MLVSSGARVSGVTVTPSAGAESVPVRGNAFASLPAASRTFVPEGGVYSRVTPVVPSAIAEARLSTVVEPDTDTAVTAGPAALAMRTRKPPAPGGTEPTSSASDQTTVTVGPAAAADEAVGRTPSTMCAGSCVRPWLRLTGLVPATVTIEPGGFRLPTGISMPFVSSSPSTTVYSKRWTAPAAWPAFHTALRVAAPTVRSRVRGALVR